MARTTKETRVDDVRAARTDTSAMQAGQKNEGVLWWLVLMQGIVAIFFGIVAVAWPGLTLVTLVYLFSAFVLAWGVIEIIHGVLSIRRRDTWWLTLLFGFIGLGVGVYLIRHPRATFSTLIIIIGLTLIIRGIFDLVDAFLGRHRTAPRALLLIIGIAALAAGILLLFQPEAAGVAFVWVLGLYAIISGALLLAVAVEARENTSYLE